MEDSKPVTCGSMAWLCVSLAGTNGTLTKKTKRLNPRDNICTKGHSNFGGKLRSRTYITYFISILYVLDSTGN
jgi:hypothetical protein